MVLFYWGITNKARGNAMIRSSFILIFISIMLLYTSCDILEQEQPYQFPIDRASVEEAINKQQLDWTIANVYIENSKSIFTLLNGDNITLGMSTQVYDHGNIINMTWSLPNNFPTDKFDEFYNTELPKLFKLVGIFYGNSDGINKGFNEFMKYYRSEDYEGGIYWTKRVGDDYIKIEIKPWLNSQDSRNRLGVLMVTSSSAYESLLKLTDEGGRKTAEIDNIKIINSTVEEISNFSENTNIDDYQPKHFLISGHLGDIKEIKTVPESLKNINSKFLKANKDKYLYAKLIDETGSIDVFLQNTSLNDNDLRRERNHNVVLFFYDNTPVIVVRYSVLLE